MTGDTKKLVLLADDHPAFRAGVSKYFAERNDFESVIEAADGIDCLEQLVKWNPDWAIIDLAMPGKTGFDVLETLVARGLETRVVVMSMHAEKAYADRARELGASAFIAKEDALTELDHALLQKEGDFYSSVSVGRVTLNLLEESTKNKLALLTPAEKKIFHLLGNGMTSREIGEELHISTRTVQTHRRNITDKLDLHGPNKLLEFAVRNTN